MQTSTDLAHIHDLVRATVAVDPVEHNVFGDLLAPLAAGTADPWCARVGAAFAVRSRPDGHVMMTAGWHDPGALAAALLALAELAGISGPEATTRSVAARLGRHVVEEMPERLFRLDDLVAPDVPGRSRLGTSADLDLLDTWFAAFRAEAFPSVTEHPPARPLLENGIRQRRPWLWLDADDRPVALAVRHPAVTGVARLGPVYTPPELRGHGFGSAATAAATRAVLDDGAVPVLYTDLRNPTSNKIYPRLGYRPLGDRLAIWFGQWPASEVVGQTR